MSTSLSRILLIVFFVVGIAIIFILLFWKNLPFYKNTQIQNISNYKVSYDITKIPDQNVRSYVKNSGNISIQLSSYVQNSLNFPLEFDTQSGKYQYNITFKSDGIDIAFAPDPNLSSNQALIHKILTQIIIASSQEKFDKNLSKGSLFDKNIRDDYINYLNKIVNNSTMNRSDIVTLTP